MTDIEAVGALKWKVAYAKEIGKSHIDNVYVEALDLAVKALEERQQGDLISREALKKYARKVMCEKDFMTKIHLELFENIIDNAPTIEIPVARWDCYCEGQKVGFKKAEDVFERMKLIQETVDCIRNKFNLNTKSNKLVRNCMALVQNAIDGEYHDMEEVDMKGGAKPTKEVIDKLGECKCNTCKNNGTWVCVNKCRCFDKYVGGAE